MPTPPPSEERTVPDRPTPEEALAAVDAFLNLAQDGEPELPEELRAWENACVEAESALPVLHDAIAELEQENATLRERDIEANDALVALEQDKVRTELHLLHAHRPTKSGACGLCGLKPFHDVHYRGCDDPRIYERRSVIAGALAARATKEVEDEG